jgi:hypothetical protein
MSQYHSRLLETYTTLHGAPDPQLHFQYSVNFLSKKNFRENDIFTVHAKLGANRKRIGWLFPVLVLGSSEYDLFNDIHFVPYLKVAASHLAKENGKRDIDENTHVLVLKDERLIEGNVFISNFSVSLLKHGYYNTASGVVAENTLCKFETSTTSEIKVENCLPVSEYSKYVNKLLCELLPKVEDPLSRFVSIYQTIELLMEKYFHLRLDEHKKRRSTIGTIRENITELSSERKLINGAFTYGSHRSMLNPDEINLARRLFNSDKDEQYYTGLTLPNFIYDTRNAIFHNYHKYELGELMRDISERMELILVELLENPKISVLLVD